MSPMVYGAPSKSYSLRSEKTPLSHDGDDDERSPHEHALPLLKKKPKLFLLSYLQRRKRIYDVSLLKGNEGKSHVSSYE